MPNHSRPHKTIHYFQASLASLAIRTAALERERAQLTRQLERWLIPDAEDYLSSLASSRCGPSTTHLTNGHDDVKSLDNELGYLQEMLRVPLGEPLLASDLAPVANGLGAQVIV